MIRWLWELLWPPRCEHEWKFLGKNTYFEEPEDKRPCRVTLVWRCTKCGMANKVST